MLLALLSLTGGWVGLPQGLLWGDAFERFLQPIVAAPAVGAFAAPAKLAGHAPPAIVLSGITTAVALIGIAIAWVFYLGNPALPDRLAESARAFYRLLLRKYYIDEIYNALVSRPLFWLSSNVLHRGIDVALIDGIANGSGLTVEGGGEGLRRAETGNVQHYAFVYLLGALAVAAYYVYLAVR
jgi:NADH-quinone oxidoreductase subunit L